MKVGDIVTFMNEESRYVRWFFGKIGVVKSITANGDYCCVRWIVPVPYHDKHTTESTFNVENFEVHCE